MDTVSRRRKTAVKEKSQNWSIEAHNAHCQFAPGYAAAPLKPPAGSKCLNAQLSHINLNISDPIFQKDVSFNQPPPFPSARLSRYLSHVQALISD